MSVQQKVPYISLRDVVVATLDGYSIGFKANTTTYVPNSKRVIAAVQAAGCVPVTEDTEAPELITIEQYSEEVAEERRIALFAAMDVIREREEPTDYTRNGAPQVRSLETISGFQISNTERDKVWKEYKAEHGIN
jgi:hypothetical protein